MTSVNRRLIKEAGRGRLSIVRQLIDKKADVNYECMSALDSAIRNGKMDVVKLLIEAKADLKRYSYLMPFDIALKRDFRNIYKYMIESKAFPSQWHLFQSAKMNDNFDVMKLLIRNGANFDSLTYKMQAPVYQEICKVLIKHALSSPWSSFRRAFKEHDLAETRLLTLIVEMI